MNLLASVEGRDLETVARRLENMCGSVHPSSEWGIVFYGPRTSPDGEIVVEVEMAGATDLDAAQAAFDAFREAVRPGDEFGLTLWNLREKETPSPAL